MDITIAIDAMGGDHGPHVTVPAALKALADDGKLPASKAAEAIKKYKLDANKPNPTTV